ncbi:hypothetical protein R3P38DRAFT_2473700, partial [Favolaschia claudopus]
VFIQTGATCTIHTETPLPMGYHHDFSNFHRVNEEGTKCVVAAAKAGGVRYHSSSPTAF